MNRFSIWLKNHKKIFLALKIIFIIVIVLTILLLPDILYRIRDFLNIVPIINKIIASKLNNELYVQFMMGSLFACMALIVSFFAFRTSKEPYKVQVEHRLEEIAISASMVRENIKNNCTIIHDLKNSVGNPSSLSINEEFKEQVQRLVSSKIITQNDKEYLLIYYSKIETIFNQNKTDSKDAMIKTIEEFCEKYFKINAVEYSKELKEITDKLDNIINGD